MSGEIRYASGASAQALFDKQQYTMGISRNMFSSHDKVKEKKCMIPPALMKGVTVAKLWDAIFSDKAEFLQRYHGSRKETNLELSKWEYAPDMASGFRTLTFQCTVDLPRGPVDTTLNQAHRFAYTSSTSGGITLVYHVSSQTPNVPMGTTFRTEALLEITAPSEDADITLAVYGGCKKMSMGFAAIQYMANPRAIKEMTRAYQQMLEMISKDLTGDVLCVQTSDVSEGTYSAKETSVSEPSASEEVGQSSTLFQGLLLVLALVVAVSLLWHLAGLQNIGRMTSLLSARVNDQTMNSAPHPSSLADALNMGSSADTKTARPSLTQDKALHHAARDVHIQSLRQRWLEQRDRIVALEASLDKLWSFFFMQLLIIMFIVVKLFMSPS
ncbi:uncharacterized protein TEOVI_000519000 [Trypanosoma equiperdum]|uniref:VASt domain-containing protein n=1 Tax=Trypanosoma equiperdum TaxID=5694 RepID=A0A1G4I5K8_TRYEQ|nr:hypothetical protein, conserved [Trypanosoma equiperdum]